METSKLNEIKEEHLSLNSTMIHILTSIAKWTKFFAILGFITCALIVLFGFFYTSVMSSFYSLMPQQAGANNDLAIQMMGKIPPYMAIIYILIALLYFFPSYYLFQFSTKMKLALSTYDNSTLEKAFTYLKSHYKFVGVLTIIGLSFYGFIFLIALATIL